MILTTVEVYEGDHDPTHIYLLVMKNIHESAIEIETGDIHTLYRRAFTNTITDYNNTRIYRLTDEEIERMVLPRII